MFKSLTWIPFFLFFKKATQLLRKPRGWKWLCLATHNQIKLARHISRRKVYAGRDDGFQDLRRIRFLSVQEVPVTHFGAVWDRMTWVDHSRRDQKASFGSIGDGHGGSGALRLSHCSCWKEMQQVQTKNRHFKPTTQTVLNTFSRAYSNKHSAGLTILQFLHIPRVDKLGLHDLKPPEKFSDEHHHIVLENVKKRWISSTNGVMGEGRKTKIP